MYLYFDRNGTLREQITTSPVRPGDINVNKIYVYWEDNNPTGGYCIYRKPDGTNTPAIYYNTFVEETIPYDQNRDLKYFKYNTPYRFCIFNMPDTESENNIFIPSADGVNSVLFSCWLIYDTDKVKGMGLVAFAVEPTTLSVKSDQNINVAQWNMLISLITGTAQFESINVKDIEFQDSESVSENGLSVKDNIIYWRGVKLATFDDVVLLSGNQTIAGNKAFTGTTTVRDFYIRKFGDSSVVIGISKTDGVYNDSYGILVKEPTDGNYTIYLPQDSGDLALTKDIGDATITIQKNGADVDTFKTNAKDNKTINIIVPTSEDYVALTGNQSIHGKKSFVNAIEIGTDGIDFQSTDGASSDEGKLTRYAYDLYFGDGNDANKIAFEKDIQTALTPNTIASAHASGFNGISKSGGNTNVSGVDTYTVAVEPGYEIVAALEHGGTITDIDQETGVISFDAGAGDTLYWHYEAVCFDFNINSSDYNGLYVFTHSYLTMLVPIYNFTDGQTYKFTGPGLQNTQGSVLNLVHNIKRSGNKLYIWSGNSDYPFIAGRTAYLSRVKLY